MDLQKYLPMWLLSKSGVPICGYHGSLLEFFSASAAPLHGAERAKSTGPESAPDAEGRAHGRDVCD